MCVCVYFKQFMNYPDRITNRFYSAKHIDLTLVDQSEDMQPLLS